MQPQPVSDVKPLGFARLRILAANEEGAAFGLDDLGIGGKVDR